MLDEKKVKESIDFVAHHYMDGAFSPKTGWARFGLICRRRRFMRNIAAACIGGVVLAASASIIYVATAGRDSSQQQEQVMEKPQHASPHYEKSMRIDFHDAPLKDVVAEIENIYDVTISNVPSEELRITISYEGSAHDVVQTINELLDINLEIATESQEK